MWTERLLHLQLLTLAVSTTGFAACPRDELKTPVVGCTCPGDVLTYTCTVTGAIGSTYWNGTSFLCQKRKIAIRHSNFVNYVDDCNSDNIHLKAKGLEVNGDCYTSQLNVTVSPEVNDRTVQCGYFNTSHISTINVSTISLTIDPPSSPNNFRLDNVTSQKLSFVWSPVETGCSQLVYILHNNCTTLSCDNRTVSTSVSCSNLNALEEKKCVFSIQPVVCGSVPGSKSAETLVLLKLPQITGVEIVPVYLQSTGEMIRLSTKFTKPSSFEIADTFSGSPSSYNITYTNSFGVQCTKSPIIDAASCPGDICTLTISVSGSFCSILTSKISVTVSATNVLGEGPTSEPIATDMMNQLVEVDYNSTSKIITCTFKTSYGGGQACSITYRKCGERTIIQTYKGNLTNEFRIKIPLKFENSVQRLCYNITARSGNTTVEIEGDINVDSNNMTAIILPIFTAILIIVLGTISFGVCMFKKKRILIFLLSNSCCICFHPLILRRLGMQEIKDRFTLYENDESDCTLLHFLKKRKKLTVARGCAYFKFTKTEDIAKCKEIILMHEETRKYYKVNRGDIIQWGINTRPPTYKGYAVFVQSYCGDMDRGSNRMIVQGAQVLYEDPSPSNLGLTLLEHDQIKKWRYQTPANLKTLFKRRLGRDWYDPTCIFCEFSRNADITDNQEIIFKEKGTQCFYLAGTRAMKMFGAPGKSVRPPNLLRWKVFIQIPSSKCLKLNETILIRTNNLN